MGETRISTPRPLHVLLVAPSLRRMLGGQEVQGDQLHRAWKNDPDVRVTIVESNPELPAFLRWAEQRRGVRTLLRLPFRLGSLWRWSRRADVVHAFSGAGTSFLVATFPALMIARLLGKPAVAHYHSPHGEAHLTGSRFARRMLRACDRVVVPSTYLQRPFAALGVPASVIANFVDSARFAPRAEAPALPLVLSIRNFEYRYGVDDVIRTFARVKATHPAAQLLLAGSGPEEGALRQLVDSLRLSDVSFTGAMSRDAMATLMRRATVLLNASRADNMPVSILEAFAVGVPVVSTSAGGIPTFARHDETALLAAVGAVDGLATHIRSLLDDQALAARLASAARREVARCTWDEVRPQWLSLYRELVETRANSRR